MIWEIKSEHIDKIKINVGEYTSFYNENETNEEDILGLVNGYFQKRGSNKNEVTIFDVENQEVVGAHTYQSFIINHEMIEKEHALGTSSMLYKCIVRNMKENVEVDGYLNSVNVLLEDVLGMVRKDLPLKLKPLDYKSFVKQLHFEYDMYEDYDKLITRLEQVMPILVEELNNQTHNQTLLIYYYPESNLSPSEQLRFKKFLQNLPVTLIVLTSSERFVATDIESMNYIKATRQCLTSELIHDLAWQAPLDYDHQEIKQSLERFILHYQNKFECSPVISNYKVADIILFEPIDLYVAVTYLKRTQHAFMVDLDDDKLPHAIKSYIAHTLHR